MCSVETDRGVKERLRFYDTAGIDPRSAKQLPSHQHAIADAYMLVYSTQDMASLQAVMELKKDVDKNRDKKDVSLFSEGRKSF